MHSYERLITWQRCHELTLATYRASACWPATERYGLTSQIRRAAASAATNIAEGAVRRGPREFAKFLRYAFSSLGEVSYQMRLARDLGYLSGEAPNQELEETCNHAIRVTWKLCQRMERAARETGSDGS